MDFDVVEYAYEAGRSARENNPCEWRRHEAWEVFLESHDDDALNSRAARNAFRRGWDGE